MLKDGTEIHRIGILAQVYDYSTGKLARHAGPRGAFVPLLDWTPAVAVEAAAPNKSSVVNLDDDAEAGS